MTRLVACVLLGLLAPPAGALEPPCVSDDDPTGLTVAAGDGGLQIRAVAPGSPADLAGIVIGDRIRQANGTVPTSCDEWRTTLASARRQELAILLLLERRPRPAAAALHGSMWTRQAPIAVSEAPPGPIATIPPPAATAAEVPTRSGEPPPGLPPVPSLPGEAAVTREQVDASLADLAADDRRDLGPYRARVVRFAREVDALGASGGAADESMTVLREIATYHRAAVIAWEAIDATRAERGLRRSMPIADTWTAPYLTDSLVARVLGALPFLAETVVREPQVGAFERGGAWQPVHARRLLWDRAAEAQRALAGTPGAD
jgi:hypothetical protein